MSVEAAHFADTLYNAWQMEYKTCRNGILLVLSIDDREASLFRTKNLSQLHVSCQAFA